MAKTKNRADDTNCGAIIGKGYCGTGLDRHGHVVVHLPKYTDGKCYVPQSCGAPPSGCGLNRYATTEQSDAGACYRRMVHPENRLLHEGDGY